MVEPLQATFHVCPGFFVLVLVLSVSGTRTRCGIFEYEYHIIEYEYEYEYEKSQNSATSKGASRFFPAERTRLARLKFNDAQDWRTRQKSGIG
jgi:hypothetical protein